MSIMNVNTDTPYAVSIDPSLTPFARFGLPAELTR
jgi:hypothetical protein